jgi:hypothetical protein
LNQENLPTRLGWLRRQKGHWTVKKIGYRASTRNGNNAPPLLSVYSGRECVGFLLNRGKTGIEAVDPDGVSRGLFPNQRQAIGALGGSSR